MFSLASASSRIGSISSALELSTIKIPTTPRFCDSSIAVWFKLTDVPAKYDKMLLQADLYRWAGDGWSEYVMAAGPIAEQIVESRPLFQRAFRLNINDKESFALSDHLPQLAVFQSNQ